MSIDHSRILLFHLVSLAMRGLKVYLIHPAIARGTTTSLMDAAGAHKHRFRTRLAIIHIFKYTRLMLEPQ